MKATLRAAGALAVGVVVGALLTLSIQGGARPIGGRRPDLPAIPVVRAEAPSTFLAWVTRGLPAGFGMRARALPEVGQVAVVAEDNVWLVRSWSAGGELVDDPPDGFFLPIDAAAVDPRTYAPFLPPPDRTSMASVAAGEAILGASSAALRGLGPGAVLDFGRGERIRVAAVLPDELVGAAEVLVSRATGRRIGVSHDRHLLLHPAPGVRMDPTSLRRLLQPLLPTDLGIYREVRVRAPGESPYFRAGDAVLPPVLLKALFGEFAARPEEGRPGYLDVEPGWARDHLETVSIPLLGTVTCHRAIVPQLEGAMDELIRRGLGDLVESYHGCYAPRFISRDPSAMISHHAWGIAIDLNLAGNLYGDPPHQDPRLVAVLERWGFLWGGDFLVPDGNHFEYRRTPARL
jgi:hypothetical protein